jgi:hypothetical protein
VKYCKAKRKLDHDSTPLSSEIRVETSLSSEIRVETSLSELRVETSLSELRVETSLSSDIRVGTPLEISCERA